MDLLRSSTFLEDPELSLTTGVLDESSMMPWSSLCSGHWKSVTAISYLPDLNSVVTGGEDGQLIIWDAVTGYQRCVRGQTVRKSPISGLARLPDGSLAVACDGLMGLLRLAPLPNAPQTLGIDPSSTESGFQSLNSPVTCLVPAAQSGVLLAGCFDGSVHQVTGPAACDIRTSVYAPRAILAARPKMVLLLCSLDTGGILLRRLCDPNGTLQLVSVGRGRRHRSLNCLDYLAGQWRPACACPVPDQDGRRAAFAWLMVGCSSLGCLDLLVVDSRGEIYAHLHAQPCHSVSLKIVCHSKRSSDYDNGNSGSITLATAAVNGEIKIWRAAFRGGDPQITMELIKVYRHDCEATALDLVELPDGARILLVGDRLGSMIVLRV